MTTLPVALMLAGCNGRTGLAGGFDSGTPVPPNANPDTAGSPVPNPDTAGSPNPNPDIAGSGYPFFTVNPPSVDFGAVDVGVTSAPLTVTVTNVGTATSGPLTVTVSGSGITTSGCAGAILAPKASCQISITARQEVAGPISGTVEVGDSPANTKKISVSAINIGGGPRLTMTPTPLDLGSVLVGKTATGTIVMSNGSIGTAATGIVINVSGTGFSLSPTGTCTETLASGQSCTIVVSFTAGSTSGPAKGTLTVSQGGVTKPLAIVATVLAPAKLVMTPTTGIFTTTAGDPSSPITFYMTNAGDALSTIPAVTISGPNKDVFSFTSDCTNKAMPGGATASCQIKVVYSPKTASAANAQATLTVAEPGAGGSSASATLTGTAQPSSPGVCVAMTPCGGDVVGTWTVKSSCLKASGPADISYLGLTCVPNVATITGSASVSGTLTLGADGKYTDNTVTTGSDSWQLDRSCTILSGTKVRCESIGTIFSGSLSTFGYESFICQDAASDGGCTCQGKINQSGGMGLLYNDVMPKGKYRTAANTLTLYDSLNYSYCVNGSEMTLSPVPGPDFSTPYKGTIVLQRSGG
jgi:hypothetical protein